MTDNNDQSNMGQEVHAQLLRDAQLDCIASPNYTATSRINDQATTAREELAQLLRDAKPKTPTLADRSEVVSLWKLFNSLSQTCDMTRFTRVKFCVAFFNNLHPEKLRQWIKAENKMTTDKARVAAESQVSVPTMEEEIKPTKFTKAFHTSEKRLSVVRHWHAVTAASQAKEFPTRVTLKLFCDTHYPTLSQSTLYGWIAKGEDQLNCVAMPLYSSSRSANGQRKSSTPGRKAYWPNSEEHLAIEINEKFSKGWRTSRKWIMVRFGTRKELKNPHSL